MVARLRDVPPSWPPIMLRTWLGAWITGCRMQRSQQCILGCDVLGAATRYICHCRRLRYHAAIVLRSDLHSCILARLGLR
eukprot:1064621-Pyramimonas_sp.AAC.1